MAFDRRGGDQTATVQRLLSILVSVPGVDALDRSDGVALVAGVRGRMGLIQQMALRMSQGDGEFAEEIGAEARAASGLDLARAGRIGNRMEREIRAPSQKMLEIQAEHGAEAMGRGEWPEGVFWAKRAGRAAPSPWAKGRWSEREREEEWREAASRLFGKDGVQIGQEVMAKAKATIGAELWGLLVAAEQSASGKWEPEEGEDILQFLQACEKGGIGMEPWGRARALAESAIIGKMARSAPKDRPAEKSAEDRPAPDRAKAPRRGI